MRCQSLLLMMQFTMKHHRSNLFTTRVLFHLLSLFSKGTMGQYLHMDRLDVEKLTLWWVTMLQRLREVSFLVHFITFSVALMVHKKVRNSWSVVPIWKSIMKRS